MLNRRPQNPVRQGLPTVWDYLQVIPEARRGKLGQSERGEGGHQRLFLSQVLFPRRSGLYLNFMWPSISTISPLRKLTRIGLFLKDQNPARDQFPLICAENSYLPASCSTSPFNFYFSFGTFISPPINVNYAYVCRPPLLQTASCHLCFSAPNGTWPAPEFSQVFTELSNVWGWRQQ